MLHDFYISRSPSSITPNYATSNYSGTTKEANQNEESLYFGSIGILKRHFFWLVLLKFLLESIICILKLPLTVKI